jgi:hypothetical protein
MMKFFPKTHVSAWESISTCPKIGSEGHWLASVCDREITRAPPIRRRSDDEKRHILLGSVLPAKDPFTGPCSLANIPPTTRLRTDQIGYKAELNMFSNTNWKARISQLFLCFFFVRFLAARPPKAFPALSPSLSLLVSEEASLIRPEATSCKAEIVLP